jgi:GNAT superfamily N-acetyltransferase
MALHGDRAVGVIAVKWQELPAPLPPTREGYINIIEVVRAYRRKGIARRLIELSLAKCRAEGVTQMRTWSTNDKTDAIPMWKALGFALCPVTHSMWRTEVTGYFVAKRVD